MPFLRLIHTKSLVSPSSIPLYKSSKLFSKQVVVECNVPNPDWFVEGSSFLQGTGRAG